MKRKIILGALLVMIFMISTASADNKVYFDPSEITISDCSKTKTVSLKLDSSDGIAGFQADIEYDPSIAKITNVQFNGNYNNMFSTATDNTNYYRLIGVNGVGDTSGDQILANLTIECMLCDGSDTNLGLTEENNMILQIASFSGEVRSAEWENGTIFCGTPACEPCLGDCYRLNDCTGVPFETDVPCHVCLGYNPANSWKPTTECPNRDLVCPTGACYTELCPQCCDGIDNDGDGAVDCPDDPGCACCCDYTEEDDPNDPTPCVPELPTIALMSIGVLGMLLLVRKRG